MLEIYVHFQILPYSCISTSPVRRKGLKGKGMLGFLREEPWMGFEIVAVEFDQDMPAECFGNSRWLVERGWLCSSAILRTRRIG